MKKCGNCGYEMPDAARFCSECGARVEDLIEVVENASLSEFDTICRLYQMEQKYHETLDIFENMESHKPIIRMSVSPPARATAQLRPYPVINPTVKMSDLWILVMIPCLIIPVIGWIVGIMLWGFVYCPAKDRLRKKMIEDIRNSEGYILACSQVDEYNRQQQAEVDAHNRRGYELYELMQEQIQEEYNKEMLAYNENIQPIQAELLSRQCDLNAAYDECRLIPESHRNISAITGIYEIMRSADYTVKEAIEIYDRKKQMDLTQQYIDAQQETNQHMAYRNSALDAQNEILYMQAELAAEANDIADEARRDANRSELVRAIQHHNTNKYLKSMSKR